MKCARRFVPYGNLVSRLLLFAAIACAFAARAETDNQVARSEVDGASGKLRSFPVRNFGARGDGEGDDTTAINSAIKAAAAGGGGVVTFAPGRYRLVRRSGAGRAPAILLRPGVDLDGEGSTLLLDDNCAYVGFQPDMTPRACVTQDAVVGDKVVYVDTTADLIAGDPISIRLGDNAWDPRETREMFFTTVSRVVDAQTLVLSHGLPCDLSVSATQKWNRAILRFRSQDNPLYSGGSIRNFNLEPGPRGNAESGIDLRCARNVLVENITAIDPGAGVVLLAYCRDIEVRHVVCTRSACVGGQASKGRVLNAWNSMHCAFEDIKGETFQGPFAFFESYCRELQCVDWQIINDWQAREGTSRQPRILLMVVQDSEADFSRLKIDGDCAGEVLFDTGGTPGHVIFRGLNADAHGRWKSFPVYAVSAEGLELDGQTYDPIQRRTSKVALQPGRTRKALPGGLPAGLWQRVVIDAKGLRTPQTMLVGGNRIRLTPEAPSVVLGNVGKLGSDYAEYPPVDGKLYVTMPDLTEKVELTFNIEYFPKTKLR